MSTPDPFAAFESERTVVKPTPRVGGGGASPPSKPAAGPALQMQAVDLGRLDLLNPLVAAASQLLALSARLRTQAQVPDVPALRASTAQAVHDFDAKARASGASAETALAARYILCTAIDESVGNTPWAAQSGWNKQSLLVQFHNETWGGEKVFQLLARLAQDVPAHRNLLELIYCVLALGFEGRYRVIDNGRAQLDAVRQRLAELIRKDRPPVETALSPHWKGVALGSGRLSEVLPLWVFAAGFLALLALAFFALRIALNQQSDATYAAVSGLRVPDVPPPPPPLPAPAPRLSKFLAPEIREGLVAVLEESDRTIVRLKGDSLFSSGSADPSRESLPVLARIGQALDEVQGDVIVAGHSDNQPIRSLRFPSNWHLSTARAEGVRAVLAGWVDPKRLQAEGKADAEPVATNGTADGRSRNRRVDIVLLAQPLGLAQAVLPATPVTGAKR